MGILDAGRNILDNPRKAAIIVNNVVRSGRTFFSKSKGTGLDIVDADWDTLILLDACRHDIFSELADGLQGQIEQKVSRGSATTEFLRNNLSGRDMTDSVYVTANPQLYRIEHGIYDSEPINVDFHAQNDVWRDEKWNDTHNTVRPEFVTEAALQAVEDYPNKRLIVHYMQPHAPYLGPSGEELPSEYLAFWGRVRSGELTVPLDIAREAYRENLELVLSEVRTLLDEIGGKTVVTADHGESLGERDWPIPIRRYGHVQGSRQKTLIEVPWLTYRNGERRDVVAEKGDSETADIDDSVVEERLQSLGYTE